MWLTCDHNCTDSYGHEWKADVPAEVSPEEGASLLAIPGGGFSIAEAPKKPPVKSRGKAAGDESDSKEGAAGDK